MSPLAEFTEGTMVQLDAEEIVLAPGWSEPAEGSDVMRTGNTVTVAMQVKNIAEPAWVEATEYAVGAIVAEGGKLYESLVGENKEHKPSTDGGVHWKELTATPTHVCTLPERYRPAVATVTPDGKFSIATTGVVTATFSLVAEAESFVPLQLSYRAADTTP